MSITDAAVKAALATVIDPGVRFLERWRVPPNG